MSVPKTVEITYALYQGLSKIVQGICRKKSQQWVRVKVSPKCGDGATFLFFEVWDLVYGRTYGQSRDNQNF